MELKAALQRIDEFILGRLKHTGNSSFEELVAVLLGAATGQTFRVCGSGRQFGRDSSSESGYGNRLMVECKHYAKDTSLDAQKLRKEISQASRSDASLDMWVLATSRAVIEQVAEELDEEAEDHGIEVVVLDMGVGGLPRLAVLMAANQDLVQQWATLHNVAFDEELESALRAVAEAPEYEIEKNSLHEKLRGAVGFKRVRQQTHEKLRATLSSRDHARREFHQNLDLCTQGGELIHRAKVSRDLDSWWCDGRAPQPAVVLGEEGMGKTWAVFDWLQTHVPPNDVPNDLPIVLPVSAHAAKFEKGDSLADLVARWLAVWLRPVTSDPSGHRVRPIDEKQLRRRLERWKRCLADGPMVLLVLDGLNEHSDREWRSLLVEVLSQWKSERVAVLATDRQHHWHQLRDSEPAAGMREIPLGGYSTEELKLALASSRLSQADIPEELLPLISIPRYCALVARFHVAMRDSGDFTKERLIYLELQDRYQSKVDYPLTKDGLSDMVRRLAEATRQNPELRSEDIQALIRPTDTNFLNIYEEIAGGGFLVAVPGSGMSARFRVEPRRLFFGFGMILADELRGMAKASRDGVEEFLCQWFEPHEDMDLKAEICGSAMFHALLDDHFPDAPLRGVIRHWLNLRNRADVAQTGFARYVVRKPRIFLDLLEEFSSDACDSQGPRDYLGYAFAEHRDDRRLQEPLRQAIERWMGFVHPLGRSMTESQGYRRGGSFGGAATGVAGGPPVDLELTPKQQTMRAAVERRAGCCLDAREVRVAGTRLTVEWDPGLFRLGGLGLALMFGGDTLRFADSLVPWAVASVVMDESGMCDLVAWVVRRAGGPVEDRLLQHARGLLSQPEDVARTAAGRLLFAIGSRAANLLIDEHDLTSVHYKAALAQHALDPCMTFFRLTNGEALRCLGREDVPLHTILNRDGASMLVVDPDIELPQGLVRRAVEGLSKIQPGAVYAGAGRSVVESELDMLAPLLCARAPAAIGDVWRAAVKSLPGRDWRGQQSLLMHLPKLSMLLGDNEVDVITAAGAALIKDAPTWPQKPDGAQRARARAEALALLAMAPHLSPEERLRRLLGRPAAVSDIERFECWFAAVGPNAAAEVVGLLHAQPSRAALIRALLVLPHLGYTLTDRDRDRLVELASAQDSGVRAFSLRVAVVAGDERLGRRLVDLHEPGGVRMDSFEGHWLKLLHYRFAGHLSFDELAPRLSAPALSWLVAARGNRPAEITLYADYLDTAWRRVLTAPDPGLEPLPQTSLSENAEPSWRVDLVEPDRENVVRFDRSNSWAPGEPSDPLAELKRIFSTNAEEETQAINEERRRKTDAVLSARLTAAFEWCGFAFDNTDLERLYDQFPQRVEGWVEPALEQSPAGGIARARLGSLLHPLCHVLLDRNPALGFRLWRILHRLGDDGPKFDAADFAFRAADSSEVQSARRMLLCECSTDADIAELALAACKHKREEWLEGTAAGLVRDERKWVKALGLTLASFADTTPASFDGLVALAAVERTWVEDGLPELRDNVHKNRLARHWYAVFLTARSTDAAWGALQIVLAQADGRLFSWRREIEKSCSDHETVRARLGFLRLGWPDGTLRSELSRDRRRKERLFGREFPSRELERFDNTPLDLD